jgi:diguanylate cyclase (GGDEF)-like protein
MLWGIGPDLQGLELQVLESPGGVLSQEAVSLDEFNTWVMRHRQPLIVTDVSKDYRFNTAEILAKTKVRSIIMAPLITGGRMHGIIRIDSYRPEMFSVDDLRLLAIISNIGVLTLYNAQLYKQTEYLAIRDDLTGLYVKRYLEEKLEAFIAEAEIDKKPFSFLLLDLDRFKDLNDQFGHSIGDKVLQKAAGIMTKAIPPSGIAARWGGEEFAIILPNMDKTSARSLGEDIRKLIEEQRFSIRREDIQTTISIGISEFPSDGNTLIDIVDKADKNLYEAKHKGRNRVVG